jgi:exopolyphosphatase/guanosine-5'-triphosphate,3'-diphosphate pyrophosphatase
MDQSYLQKIESMSLSRKDDELVISVSTTSDYTLERGIFRENVDFFEEIFNLKPVLKMKGRR